MSDKISELSEMSKSIRSPRACKLAFSRRADLLKRFEEAIGRLTEADRNSVLRSFRAVLSNGRVAVNMTVPDLRRFLREGRWLNIYESVAKEGKEKGLKGVELERMVARRLRKFARPRQKIDKLLRFRKDTHYLYLNLGGGGPQRYGICSVIFDISRWEPFYTCFAGDSILSSFVWNGSRLRPIEDEEILRNFALGMDWFLLAVVGYEKYLSRLEFGVSLSDVRDLFESDDSLFEFHLHGPVVRDFVSEVRIPQKFYGPLCIELADIGDVRHPEVERYAKVLLFRDVMQLLDHYEIPLVVGE